MWSCCQWQHNVSESMPCRFDTTKNDFYWCLHVTSSMLDMHLKLLATIPHQMTVSLWWHQMSGSTLTARLKGTWYVQPSLTSSTWNQSTHSHCHTAQAVEWKSYSFHLNRISDASLRVIQFVHFCCERWVQKLANGFGFCLQFSIV